MGNCASEPKVVKGDDAVPPVELVKEEVKEAEIRPAAQDPKPEVDEPEKKAQEGPNIIAVEEKKDDVDVKANTDTQQSLGSLLDEGMVEAKKEDKASLIEAEEPITREEKKDDAPQLELLPTKNVEEEEPKPDVVVDTPIVAAVSPKESAEKTSQMVDFPEESTNDKEVK